MHDLTVDSAQTSHSMVGSGSDFLEHFRDETTVVSAGL